MNRARQILASSAMAVGSMAGAAHPTHADALPQAATEHVAFDHTADGTPGPDPGFVDTVKDAGIEVGFEVGVAAVTAAAVLAPLMAKAKLENKKRVSGEE